MLRLPKHIGAQGVAVVVSLGLGFTWKGFGIECQVFVQELFVWYFSGMFLRYLGIHKVFFPRFLEFSIVFR